MDTRVRLRRCVRAGLALIGALAAGSAPAATFAGIDVSLVGSATVLPNGDLQLTPPAGPRAGAAWATNPVSTNLEFSTSFEFSITPSTTFPMGDGIAFAIQATGAGSLGADGGGLAVKGLDAVAFVIQTSANNRLGFTASGDPIEAPVAAQNLGGAGPFSGYLAIGYDLGSTQLFATGELLGLPAPYQIATSIEINLEQRFGPMVYLGLTSGTSGSHADHRSTYWSIVAIPEPGTYSLVLTGLALLGWHWRRRTA